MALGAMLGGFWDQVGSQFGTKLAPKSTNKEYKNYVKKRYQKKIENGAPDKKGFSLLYLGRD